MKVKLMDLLDAMNYTGIGVHFLYHLKTGEIVMLSDKVFGFGRSDALERDIRKNPDAYIDLPGEYEIDELGMMDTYAENFPESSFKDALLDSLEGRSPYQAFEELLEKEGLLEDWKQYRLSEFSWIARKWAADNGITVEE
ncbi:MAG: UPF0158 family protein [Lachnospiraceae bacterium]|nr:UPF0158 family protein [Lachnospiraceae bacterium]